VLENQYGPTEAHVVSAHRLSGDPASWPELPPIGRPVANVRLYVLDEEMRALPVGVTGELYIGGEALARGYLGRPALTAERFVPDPYASAPGARLYRTGDLARYRSGGEIEFLGRRDQQVKVRGYRVEVGEVEATLRRHPRVREAVVVAHAAGAEKRLVAYVLVENEDDPNPIELRAHLAETLPDYMTPATFVLMREWPLTPSGKVDRRALPAPEEAQTALSNGYVGPRTAAEEVMAEIWAELLGVERVGVMDNFFELGGHSLLAARVAARVREALQCEVPLRRLFETPTVAGLVEYVTRELGGADVVEEVARTFNVLRHLSDEEVRVLLAEQAGGRFD
jgi:non-ribosomal peptide synthetase component E (peptide arylation enzyme)